MFKVRALIACAALALLMSGCATEGLAFVKDERVEILSPENSSTITLPLTIDWEVDGFEITGANGEAQPDAGYFGIFIDGSPVPPGKPLAWVAHNDRACVNSEDCPDDQYLADRGVYTTTETSFTLKRLTDQDAYRGHEYHEFTIILLDGTGHRIGESAWYVSFFYDREVL